MGEEKIKELIAYLASIEFKGARFEAEIRRHINQGMPYFSVRYKMDYSGEQMFYDLRFRRDHQFDAYRLEGYKATLRKPVEIDHRMINGIDTRELEERIKKIDWFAHFEKPDNVPNDVETAKVISDLLALGYNHNPEGIKIQELLQFKYFPEKYFNERLKGLQSQYDRSQGFTVTENGICNAHLAYHLLSGRLDKLYEKLRYLELDQYPSIDVYVKLENLLSKNPDAFELKCFRNEPEGYGEYVVPVTQINNQYSVDTYTVCLTPYPPIEHGTYNGINTSELEKMMQKIDWHNDQELFTLYEEREPELKPQVEEIVSQIHKLSKVANGDRIAGQLKLKYWADASFLDSLIEQRTWDYLESLPKRIQQFPVEIKARMAFNLLCGRAALNANPLHQKEEENGTWMQLDLSHKDESGNYPMRTMEGFPVSDLEKLLNLLPIDGMDFYAIRNGLKQGDLLPVRLNDDRKVMLQANPEGKTIDIYTPDMRPIYVNLKLDPDWKPSIIQKENVREIKSKALSEPKQNIFSKQSKKRHRRGRRM